MYQRIPREGKIALAVLAGILMLKMGGRNKSTPAEQVPRTSESRPQPEKPREEDSLARAEVWSRKAAPPETRSPSDPEATARRWVEGFSSTDKLEVGGKFVEFTMRADEILDDDQLSFVEKQGRLTEILDQYDRSAADPQGKQKGIDRAYENLLAGQYDGGEDMAASRIDDEQDRLDQTDAQDEQARQNSRKLISGLRQAVAQAVDEEEIRTGLSRFGEILVGR